MNTDDPVARISRSTTIALLLSPVGILLISATRLLIVSDYNPATALAISSSQGYLNTLLGTIIPIVPIYMPYLALLLLFSGRIIPGVLALLATALISAPSVSKSVMLSIAKKDWHLIVQGSGAHQAVLILLGAPFAGLLFATLLGFNSAVFIRTLGIVLSVALIPLAVRLYPFPTTNSVYANLISQPWLPAETITLTPHRDIVGYTLSSDGYWLEVLVADSRNIEYYRVGDVIEREICQMNGQAQARPLIALMPTRSLIPLCPQHNAGSMAMPPVANMHSTVGGREIHI
jgi:hypothetical protein